MAKKNKIDSAENFFDNFLIFSLSTDAQDYHLAFLLNKALDLHLFKTTDLLVTEGAGTIHNYTSYYYKPECYSEYFLLRNTEQNGALISVFLFIIKGFQDRKMKLDLIDKINSIERIVQLHEVQFNNSGQSAKLSKGEIYLKHLLTDLEFHTLKIKKLENENTIALRVEKPLRPRILY